MAHILIAEDEAHIRFLLQKVLEADGHSITEANDGLEALKVLDVSKQAIDLILLDIRMPNMDGIEFLSTLRHRHHAPPVVILTAHLDKIPDALKDDISGHLIKPFSRHQLLDLVDGALNAPTA